MVPNGGCVLEGMAPCTARFRDGAGGGGGECSTPGCSPCAGGPPCAPPPTPGPPSTHLFVSDARPAALPNGPQRGRIGRRVGSRTWGGREPRGPVPGRFIVSKLPTAARVLIFRTAMSADGAQRSGVVLRLLVPGCTLDDPLLVLRENVLSRAARGKPVRCARVIGRSGELERAPGSWRRVSRAVLLRKRTNDRISPSASPVPGDAIRARCAR